MGLKDSITEHVDVVYESDKGFPQNNHYLVANAPEIRLECEHSSMIAKNVSVL